MNSQKNLLIVEDDNELRASLVSKLEPENYQILQAQDGEMAMQIAVDEHPDVILLDLMLPKLDGFKVLERIRHYPDKSVAQIKVVVLSNLWSNKDILRAQALKVEEYFVKSNTTLEEVVKKIKEVFSVPAGKK